MANLLSYIEQVEKLNHKPAYGIAADELLGYQSEIEALPGVLVNQAEAWLKIARLPKNPPPALPSRLAGWCSLSDDPKKTPTLAARGPIADADGQSVSGDLERHPEIGALFEAYQRELWRPWAREESQNRASIRLYQKLFQLHQSASQDGAEAPVELIWGSGVASWAPEGKKIQHPLITQVCELSLNAEDFSIEIRARDAEPRLELDCYAELQNPGVKSLEARWSEFLAGAEREGHALTPFAQPGFSGALATAAAELSPSGVYADASQPPPAPGPQLVVSGSWVLFFRERSGHFLLKDVERLKEAAKAQELAGVALPPALSAFVTPGKDETKTRSRAVFRGLSSGSGAQGAQELYFPLPYNEEQVAIARELEANDGVVVMGPPGTGKTHTIANVICHYLAQGKKVLVTAKGETALSVLKEKLPEQVQRLCVSLLTDERDGMRQFEQSISTITTEVAALDPEAAEREILLLEGRLDEEHSAIADCERRIGEFAHQHLSAYERSGKKELLLDIANALAAQSEGLWIEHDALPGQAPLVTNEAIRAAGEARLRAGACLRSLREPTPSPRGLPSASHIGSLARELAERQGLLAAFERGEALSIAAGVFTAPERELLALASEMAQSLADAASARQSEAWLSDFERRSAQGQIPAAARPLMARAAELENRRQALLIHAVSAPEAAEGSQDYQEALARLAQGQKAFGLLSFGKDEAKALLAQTQIGGQPPQSAEQWRLAQERFAFLKEARALMSQWSALGEEAGWPEVGGSRDKAVKEIARLARLAARSEELSAAASKALARAQGLFPALSGSSPDEDFFRVLASRLAAGARLAALTARREEQNALISLLSAHQGPASDAASRVALSLASQHPESLEAVWQESLDELAKIEGLADDFAAIEAAADLAERSGAQAWAARLRSEPALGAADPLSSSSWSEAWEWRAWDNLLASLDDPQALRKLFAERSDAEARLAHVYERLIVKKTWLGAQKNCTESVRQRLQQYLNAVQAMGKGTGVRAQRHRATARAAMSEAYKAVSCWIMPQWRVSEAMAPEMGMFDLVIIDEASQSDIWALPALARGKKVLIVGDPKQVSPGAIGVAEDKILELSARFLKGQPYKAEMTPDKSIYSLASVVFAGNSVMLKEHFRTAPAIIEYSNRSFYNGQIQPLRSAKPGRELNPPLVDVFVPGGFRKGDANPPEARAIVNEIKIILRDPACAGKSLGVVTLLGQEQAALITRMVHEEIDPADIIARRISVGAPPVFQGKERDIILLSMALQAGDRSVADKLESEQRLNVAMSRARDRVYLFRSVEESAFPPDSLSAKLIRHFRQPFALTPERRADLRELCESDFERAFYDLLVERGYRVTPQFPCCGFRIDFVVEGEGGQRLAIECDGDRYHGPDQWLADMARQRVLERAGWSFWRCFASSFARRPLEVKSDLFRALAAQGIRPFVGEAPAPSALTERRQAAPFKAGAEGSP